LVVGLTWAIADRGYLLPYSEPGVPDVLIRFLFL
jgi:hypothetical protein